MSSIIELADCIILDDVTDVFYRKLSFSNYARTLYDEKSAAEEAFDNLISERLLKKLDWQNTMFCQLPAVKFICSFLKSYESNQLTEGYCEQLVDTHTAAFEYDLSSKALKHEFLNACNYSPIEIYDIVWRLFQSNLHGPNKLLFGLIQTFSQQVVTRSLQKGYSYQEHELNKVALFNALPMLILLKLLDHEIGVVNNLIDVDVADPVIEPTAETVFSFLIFDEFLKPHILEYIDQEHYYTWINIQSGELDEISKVFLDARKDVILDALAGDFVLTSTQKRKFSEQVGSKFKICSQVSNLANYSAFWRKLLDVGA